MKYKVVDFVSDYQESEFGTCELCFYTCEVENGYIVLEDESGKRYEISLTVWYWGGFDTLYISNLVDFSAWLQERDEPDFEEIEDDWVWLHKLVDNYCKEHELEEAQ